LENGKVGTIPALLEVADEVVLALRRRGGLAMVFIDLADIERVERSFGPAAYDAVRLQVEPLMAEVRERARPDDILACDSREGDRFFLFLTGERPGTFSADEIRRLADRIDDLIAPRVARLTLPFSRERTVVHVGHAFVIFNPLANPTRQIQRLIDEARQSAALRRTVREQKHREELLEIIHNRRIWTAFQPIVEIEGRKVMGHEALARGPRGTELEPPMSLFGLAARHGLLEELERSCRHQTFQDWDLFGGVGRLFINTVPATVRDPSFLGRGIIDALGSNLSPRLVTLEITERQVIENLSLYREAMHTFLEMGFTFAIDDLGAGYSGLETLVNLGASYLKIDMGLVRDVHQKRISQQVVRAIADMGTAVAATVIAEGIQAPEEAEALLALGVRFGQGYLFGRPIDSQSGRAAALARGA
jgi:EAL domain-containing protein (putative c-di-GMP-specific phosphodiesterase class I)/GGDEF domain-containing protein